jgi:ATP synthase protein I
VLQARVCNLHVILMTTMAPAHLEDDAEASDFTPLTAEQAQKLREQSPSVSPWWVVLAQVGIGVVVVLLSWFISGRAVIAVSAACGVLAVVLPSALFARGVTGRFAAANVGSAVFSFFLWELVKIVMTVAVMYAAYRSVENLSWPAMLVGLVLTMKVYWLALAVKRKPRAVQNVTLNGKSN